MNTFLSINTSLIDDNSVCKIIIFCSEPSSFITKFLHKLYQQKFQTSFIHIHFFIPLYIQIFQKPDKQAPNHNFPKFSI